MENRDLGIRTTGDGSITCYSDRFKQHYHSVHGARTESEKVYLDLGYALAAERFARIELLEVGFGTGLNAYLTALASEKVPTFYTGLEAFSIEEQEWRQFPEYLRVLHGLSWEEEHTIHPLFNVIKLRTKLEDFLPDKRFHLVYYDAFSPEAQPELWTSERFAQVYGWMEAGGILCTYCSKVLVQKNLKSAGFEVEKHPGPPHKREVIRAIKK